MNSHERGKLAVAFLLTGIAGDVDAIAFLGHQHLFVSFLSGDSTHIAVALGGGSWAGAGFPAAILALYVSGVVAGRLLVHLSRRWHRPLILFIEALLLAVAALTPLTRAAAVVVMALAMGVQNAAMHRVGQTKVHLTYVTGTLVSFAEGLTDDLVLSNRATRWQWLTYLFQWLALMVGALVGALAYAIWHMRALLVPVGIIGSVAIATFLVSGTGGGPAERLGGRA